MTWGAVAAAGATLVVGYMNKQSQKKAGNAASAAQTQAAQAGIDEQRRQFDQLQTLLSPYAKAGVPALQQQQALAGALGPQAQQAAINALQQTPGFTSQLKLGENRILANASATGGLRGGNTQAALSYFAPSLLSQTINDQYNRLGGLVGIGENAAAMTGNAGMQLGSQVSGLMQQQGSAQAGAALNNGRADIGFNNSLISALGQYMGQRGTGGF